LGLGEEPRDGAPKVRTSSIDVSIVIVSWNVRDFLRGCIESIVSTQGDLSVEIIVVDNASDDRSAEIARSEFPEIDLIETEANVGFGPANNIGLQSAKGQYVFFLNPDTVLQEKALVQLFEFLDRHKGFDLVGPQLYSPDGSLQWACARQLPSFVLMLFEALYLHRLPLIGQHLLNRMIGHYDLSESQEVDAISGAAMLGRRSVMSDVHGFDEAFLHTGEDMDLCLRLRERGSRIFYLADARVLHFGGQSSSQAWARSGTMGVLSTERYLARSRGRFHAWMYRLIVQFVQMPIMVMVGLMKALLRRGEPQEIRRRLAFARAVWRWRLDK
jgi:GT2 family glycosyltransferase